MDDRTNGTESRAVRGDEGLRLMVALDFSQSSLRALEWAGALANGRKAVVHLVHAIEPTPLANIADAAGSLCDLGEKRLHRAAEGLRIRGIETRSHVDIGRPWQVVRSVAARVAPDLVLLGNRGLSPIKRVLLGSNADRVLRTIEAPTLLVHAADAPPERLRVLIATDFSEDADEAARAFRALFSRSLLRYEVRVLHAALPQAVTESVDVPLIERVDWPQLEAEATGMAESVARPFRSDGTEATVAIERGGSARTILGEARAWRADLIVLGRRGASGFERMLLGSTAERVMHGAACAVFSAQRAPVEAALPGRARAAYIA
ncbi:MAG: hypothetical protein RLZZ238_676 [Planctomycetota bacterium]